MFILPEIVIHFVQCLFNLFLVICRNTVVCVCMLLLSLCIEGSTTEVSYHVSYSKGGRFHSEWTIIFHASTSNKGTVYV